MNRLTGNIVLFCQFVFFLGYFSNRLILPSSAQISPDGSTSTIVEADGNSFTINNGEQAANNLFHSFQAFSVPTRGEAFFNNDINITNIFSRVTGGNISNIDGLIRTNGAANLFLVNPAGIIFGENASLNIGGSFYSSTADSIVFDDGEFSAFDSAEPALLIINAPIGLNFRDNPTDIQVQGANLAVPSGRTLALIGGNININGGSLTAPGGQIELGSLTGTGTVNFVENLNLNLQNIARGDIFISNSAFLNTGSDNGGTISFQAKDLTIANAALFSGIPPGSGVSESQGGNIEIETTESVAVLDGGRLNSSSFGTGNAGNITIDAANNVTIDNSQLDANSFQLGNAGNIIINSSSSVTVDNQTFLRSTSNNPGQGGNIDIFSENFVLNNESLISTVTTGDGPAGDVSIQADSLLLDNGSVVLTAATGTADSGDINVEADSISLINGGELSSATIGAGNAGNINVNASDSVILVGTAPVKVINGSQGGFSSGFFSNSDAPATGQGGTVTVTTGRLEVSDGATLGARARSEGVGGNIIVNANTIEINGGGQIVTAAFADGDAGNIILNVAEEISISGSDPNFFTRREQVIELVNQINTGQIVDPEQTIDPISPESGVFASTGSNSTGNAGSIAINGLRQEENSGQLSLPQLTLSDNGQISVNSQGEGNAGNLTITANSIEVTNGSITAATNIGNEGNITLDILDNVILRDNSLISARALSDADGGNININSQFIIAFPNQSSGNGSDIVADALEGMGGEIKITAESLLGIQERTAIEGNGTNDIDASSDFGLDGNVSITTPDTHALQTDINLPNNPIKSEKTVTQACRNTDLNEDKTNNLTIKGKGGIPTQPTQPLDSHHILVNEPTTHPISQAQDLEIRPIKTSVGDIFPARGIIKTDDGKIILTAYPIDNMTQRTPNIRANCASL
ncbi:filamentous hemagglutinin family N-terminal domain [Xenococcus sp. PCC 7305]|uniref:two-partner secretion domain-containing protein n=1 Tax=Xenococcus sp. PCC 7305 TaxID=102125 RepID=UPI0002AC5136|nr:filamentous hemagglutinin N-terminal domain-containing protein [Xenococcus sp. PCC 7305]ELS02817.1 filamentous hemagglutinin family N-terminal domain [Xenococcus sp. PCC 7305]